MTSDGSSGRDPFVPQVFFTETGNYVCYPDHEGNWPVRPTADPQVVVHWSSGPTTPNPKIVGPHSIGGMLNGVDIRVIHAEGVPEQIEDDDHPVVRLVESKLNQIELLGWKKTL